jgi:hypothetical protein
MKVETQGSIGAENVCDDNDVRRRCLIAYAIGDRPALVPGMIGGWIANTGSLYDSKAGAGFIGAIVTGFLAG